jgi:ribA/ribD-fused uncharacterized protein
MAIEQFQGQYEYLNNMFRQRVGNLVLPEGIEVPTVEHGYQADRLLDPADRLTVLASPTGHLAKVTTRNLKKAGAPIDPRWKERRLPVMRGFVLQKFTRNHDLADQLLSTGDQFLAEGNDWGDKFWGICPPFTQNGENWLGKILMETREELRLDPGRIGE